jgi:hypothetical protein
VVERPLPYQAVAGGGGSRRALLRRFQDAVVYEPLADGAIVVLACVHPRQDADAWPPPAR